MRLLIVDDHPETRGMIRELVGHLATEIQECASGEEAIRLCHACSPDVVTMDVHLPTMNGLEAAWHLRTRHPSVCIVVITQSNSESMRSAALRVGANHCLPKDDLIQLRRYLEERLQNPEASSSKSK